MLECLKNSIKYENDIIDEKRLSRIVSYSRSLNNNPPDLRTIFKLFKPNLDIIRTEDIFISSNLNFNRNFNVNLVGMNWKDIDLNKIQEIINKYYENLNLEDGFKNYIMFELIHPFLDGNGRIGRFIFLEHPLKLYFSNCLNNKRNKKLHNRLFSMYFPKIRLCYRDSVLMDWKTRKRFVYKDWNFYLNLQLNDEAKKIIHELLKF